MLRRLHVRNYVLIDSLEIDFPEGLIIITGQTGAGKSIILGSISLVLGAKADMSVIGEAAENCVVEAEFDSVPEGLRPMLEEHEVEWDEGHLILRRVVNRTGRSRSFVNDSPVPVSVLASLASSLIDIHSQHQTMLLSDKTFQMSVLDHFAGNAALLKECSEAYSQYSALKSALADLEGRIARVESERDYNEARFRQLDAAGLRDGELEELEAEQKQLANAEDIKENLMAVSGLLSGSEENMSIDAALRETEKRLDRISDFIPSLSGISERISSCRVELDDILSEIDGINSRTDVSADRLQTVDDRISFIYGLFQKFGCRTEAELIEIRDSLSEILIDSSELEAKKEELRSSMQKKLSKLKEISAGLHKARAEAAPSLASEIEKSIRFLELENAVFEVELNDSALSPTGEDAVMFKFSSTGKRPVDVARCASGGEMSRIMLCLKAMMARFAKMPTMIFDEIDTGVSGSVADKMGSMICDMGNNMQVFAITHLPQVAAKGKAHYLVSKESDPSGRTVTTIRQLTSGQRINEVARMLSGSTITEAALANARELLGQI